MKIINIIGIFLISMIVLTAQENTKKNVSVTVYNSNLGVIKETREMNITKGTSQIKIDDVASFIDPTSVHFNFNGFVLEQNYQYDLVSLDKILLKYIDKEIKLIDEKGNLIEGTLLSAAGSQIVLANKNSGLIMLPNVNNYRFAVESLPEGLITKPTLVWLVDSKISGKQDVDVSYQTSNMSWSTEYVAVLNENDTKLDLNSWVSIENNSGATYQNANLKLVAGDVNLVTNQAGGRYNQPMYKEEAYTMVQKDQFQEKEFFEYHIYKLERPSTIANNETKQISLFEAKDVSVKKKFLFKSGGYGGNKKVQVIVEFENNENNNLGKPMPKGKFRVYKSDGESVEFIGEDMIDHTAKKENVKLKIGEAFDIVVEETQIDNKKITEKVYEQTWEVKIKNRKKDDINVDVEKYLGNFWEVTYNTVDYTKKNAATINFSVPVKADSETILKYKVKYNY
ncbi:MAG: DUF4139 domain-containing protein [bacterium]